jgi:hypothetical protein
MLGISNAEATALLSQWERLIEKMAYKAHARASQITSDLDIDDFRQIIRLTILRAKKSFDETRGVKFITFVYRAIYNEIDRALRVEQSRLNAGYRVYSENSGSGEEEFSLFDSMGGQTFATPEQEIEALDLITYLKGRLSREAYALAAVMIDPPEAIRQQVEAYQAGVDEMRDSSEIRLWCSKDLTTKIAAELLGIKYPSRVVAEIRAGVEKWERS